MIRFYLFYFLAGSVSLYSFPSYKEETKTSSPSPYKEIREDVHNESLVREQEEPSVTEENADFLSALDYLKNNAPEIRAVSSLLEASGEALAENIQAVPIVAVKQPNKFKFTNFIINSDDSKIEEATYSWKQYNESTGKYAPTDRFKPLKGNTKVDRQDSAALEMPLERYQDHVSRRSSINKKIASYEAELNALERSPSVTSPEGIFFLKENLIPVWNAAAKYQELVNQRLVKSFHDQQVKIEVSRATMTEDLKGALEKQDVGMVALKRTADLYYSHFMANFMKINEAPNKIELAAQGIENDIYECTALEQMLTSFDEVKAQSNQRVITLSEYEINNLENTCTLLREIIRLKKDLINEKAHYALLLRPPYEEGDALLQAAIKEKKESYQKIEKNLSDEKSFLFLVNVNRTTPRISKKIAENQIVHEKEKSNPNQRVIDLYTQAARKHRTVVIQGFWSPRAEYWSFAGASLMRAAEEVQKTNPNEIVVDLYTQAVRKYEEAAGVQDLNQEERAGYWSFAGASLMRAAEEVQKTNPNEIVVDLYTQAARKYEEAAVIQDLNQGEKAGCLSSAGECLAAAAEEAQNFNSKERVVDLYTRAAGKYKEAAGVQDLNQEEKVKCLYEVGRWLTSAAKTAQCLYPDERDVYMYITAARLCEEAYLKKLELQKVSRKARAPIST